MLTHKQISLLNFLLPNSTSSSMGQDVLSSPKKKNWEGKLAWLLLEALRTMDWPGAVKSYRVPWPGGESDWLLRVYSHAHLDTGACGSMGGLLFMHLGLHARIRACVHLRVFFQGMFWPPVCRVLLKPAD